MVRKGDQNIMDLAEVIPVLVILFAGTIASFAYWWYEEQRNGNHQ